MSPYRERRFENDYKISIMMLESLVKPVMLYETERWGWKEQAKLKSVQVRYLRSIVGLDKQTHRYIVMEETKMSELRLEAGKMALKRWNETEKKILKSVGERHAKRMKLNER